MSKMNILKKNWQDLRSLILVFNFILIYLFYFLFIILKGFASLNISASSQVLFLFNVSIAKRPKTQNTSFNFQQI